MHRRQKSELLLVDNEIERTLKNLKKVKVLEKVAMVEQEGTDQHVPIETIAERPQRQRTMEDF